MLLFPFEALPYAVLLAAALIWAPWLILRAARFGLRELVLIRNYTRWHVFNRRTTLDRRIRQHPFGGPEQRSGRDRRSLVIAA
jgi:hypothetical protein